MMIMKNSWLYSYLAQMKKMTNLGWHQPPGAKINCKT